MLTTGTWLLFWSIPARDASIGPTEIGAPGPSRRRSERRPWIIAGTVGLAAATGVVALALGHRAVEVRVDESKLPQLPAPEQLPPVSLPGFRYTHPRLPSPSAADLATLASRNPDFLRQVARPGPTEATATSRRRRCRRSIEPGSVDLNVLHRRLMELKFTWRGHDQVKPLGGRLRLAVPAVE